MRTWQVERRKRTRHLIELGGLIVKAGIVDLTGDDRAMIYGALLWMADKLQSDEGDKREASGPRRESRHSRITEHQHRQKTRPFDGVAVREKERAPTHRPARAVWHRAAGEVALFPHDGGQMLGLRYPEKRPIRFAALEAGKEAPVIFRHGGDHRGDDRLPRGLKVRERDRS